jgi:hypothetical protein
MNKTINDYTIFEEVWHAISHGFGLFLSTFGFGVLFGMALLDGDAARNFLLCKREYQTQPRYLAPFCAWR